MANENQINLHIFIY